MEDWLRSLLRRSGAVGVGMIVGMGAFASVILADAPTANAKPPEIERVTPNSGSTAGGTEVEIVGKVLAPNGPCTFQVFGPTCPELIVYFGSEPGFIFEATKSKILAISPANQPGPVAVRVASPMGTSTSVKNKNDTFTYNGSPPEQHMGEMPMINEVSPSSGPESGFNPVEITGEHLLPTGTQACVQCSGVVVHFGAGSANEANVAVAEGLQSGLLVYAPPHAPGTVNVTVTTNPGATSEISGAASYTYVDPPAKRTR